jgi:hypothetical protein
MQVRPWKKHRQSDVVPLLGEPKRSWKSQHHKRTLLVQQEWLMRPLSHKYQQ